MLENDVVDETDYPEDNYKDNEKYRIDHSHEGLADFHFHVCLLFLCPDLLSINLFPRVLLLRLPVYVGLYDDVHEGFEETEDQPAVDHLDVGGRGEVGAHTIIELIFR